MWEELFPSSSQTNTISSFSTHPSTLEISWLTPPTSCFLAQIHRVRQIILFLNILNLGWPSEQVPAKQTLFPPLHTSLYPGITLVNSSHLLFPSPNSSYTTDYSFLEHFEFGLAF